MWLSTRDRDQSSRSVTSRSPISRLTIKTGTFLTQRGVLTDIQGEGRFSHAGPGGDDDELVGMKAVGEVVEVEEARADPGHGMFLDGALLDQVHRLLENLLELVRLSPGLVLGDGEDLLLGRLQQLLRR